MRHAGCLMLLLLAAGCGARPAASAANLAETPAKPARPGVDWPTFLGPTHDSVSPETGILKGWPREGLKLLWEAELGVGYAPPVVAEGRLVHADRVRDAIRTTCRDAATGKELWTHEYPTDYEDFYGYDPGPRSSPLVAGGRAFVYGPEGVLVALELATGKELWRRNLAQEYRVHQNFFGVGSAPVLAGGTLIVTVGGSPDGPRPDDFREVKPSGTAVLGLDPATGKERYRVGNDLASYASPVLATINGRPWCLHLARGGLIGFDPRDGKLDFQYRYRSRLLESVNASNPVVVGTRVLVTECYENGAALLELKSGKPELLWTDLTADRDEKRLACHWNTPVVLGGHAYGSSGRHESQAELRCVHLESGAVRWAVPELSRASCLGVDGHLLTLTERGVLLLVKANPEKYEEVARWKTDLRHPTWAAPVLSRGLLYLRGRGRLICCELIPEAK